MAWLDNGKNASGAWVSLLWKIETVLLGSQQAIQPCSATSAKVEETCKNSQQCDQSRNVSR